VLLQVLLLVHHDLAVGEEEREHLREEREGHGLVDVQDVDALPAVLAHDVDDDSRLLHPQREARHPGLVLVHLHLGLGPLEPRQVLLVDVPARAPEVVLRVPERAQARTS
jgi:hypothetical protein